MTLPAADLALGAPPAERIGPAVPMRDRQLPPEPVNLADEPQLPIGRRAPQAPRPLAVLPPDPIEELLHRGQVYPRSSVMTTSK